LLGFQRWDTLVFMLATQARILPMLATSAEPFDDPGWLFETKHDGVRALMSIEHDHVRVWGRDGQSYDGRYPELDELRSLPSGTVLDGELVVLRHGLPDFHALMARHARRSPPRFVTDPIRYVAFALLPLGKRSLVNLPLSERRDLLHATLPDDGLVTACEGVIGKGKRFFEKMVLAGHEGIVAKRINSRYTPNSRNGAWKKIKRRMLLACVAFGYRVDREGVKDVLLATMVDDAEMEYVGAVELGITGGAVERLESLRTSKPAIPFANPGRAIRWVKPSLLCVVQFCGWRPGGWWRDACVVAWGE